METLKSVARKSVPLTAKDIEDLDRLRLSAPHRAALGERFGLTVAASDSEASLLHSVLVAGLRAVNEEVEAAGYAALAEERSQSERKASARRRPPAWADE